MSFETWIFPKSRDTLTCHVFAETPKPYKDKQGEASAIRYVASQPIKLGSQMNERKLKQLPYHLAKSANLKDLKKACLLNFDFLIHKMFCLPIE